MKCVPILGWHHCSPTTSSENASSEDRTDVHTVDAQQSSISVHLPHFSKKSTKAGYSQTESQEEAILQTQLKCSHQHQ